MKTILGPTSLQLRCIILCINEPAYPHWWKKSSKLGKRKQILDSGRKQIDEIKLLKSLCPVDKEALKYNLFSHQAFIYLSQVLSCHNFTESADTAREGLSG